MADETNQLRVRLVTPECILFEHLATAVELPAKTGYMEVLYGHAPLVAELGAGDVTLHGGPAARRASAATTSVGALPRCWATGSPSWPPTPSGPRRLMCPAPRSNWSVAAGNGTKPARARKPILKPSASSPKPKPSWPRRRKGLLPKSSAFGESACERNSLKAQASSGPRLTSGLEPWAGTGTRAVEKLKAFFAFCFFMVLFPAPPSPCAFKGFPEMK